ncbi:MAG: hypothetical protein KAI24_23335 [Planctomycetes bacterium]|nr:hypothetical protein [Planctomycetota bacterium]
MTLPNDDIIQFLDGRFVLCHRNIEKEEHVGMSHGYKPTQSAVGTTNGAGPRNVQFLVLAHDETVLHAMPGFWHASDLIKELTLALEIDRLYGDESVDTGRKQQMFGMLHKSFLRHHGDELERRGQWQGFDRWHEIQRVQTEERDTFFKNDKGEYELKSVPQVVHDRMIARPFQKLDEFDLETFVDYGRPFYDNNHHDRGKNFTKAERANRKRAAEQEAERKQAALLAAKEERERKRRERRNRSKK